MRKQSALEKIALDKRNKVLNARNGFRKAYRELIEAHKDNRGDLNLAFYLADNDVKSITGVC